MFTPLFRFALPVGMACLTACASLSPDRLPAGAPIADARALFGGPTAEYPLAGGATRLEFARGSFGRETYMLDFDAGGHLVKSEQVLTEGNFAKVAPGQSSDDLRMRLGRPAQVFNIGWQNLQVWNYRFPAADCVWYQVSIDDSRRVKESNYGTDPACDGPNGRD
ncbi:MAG: hypothetical protein ABIV63_06980 [Caldimonas sp.]